MPGTPVWRRWSSTVWYAARDGGPAPRSAIRCFAGRRARLAERRTRRGHRRRSAAGEPEPNLVALHRVARDAGADLLAGVHGKALVALIGTAEDPLALIGGLLSCYADGPVVVGPVVPGLAAATSPRRRRSGGFGWLPHGRGRRGRCRRARCSASARWWASRRRVRSCWRPCTSRSPRREENFLKQSRPMLRSGQHRRRSAVALRACQYGPLSPEPRDGAHRTSRDRASGRFSVACRPCARPVANRRKLPSNLWEYYKERVRDLVRAVNAVTHQSPGG